MGGFNFFLFYFNISFIRNNNHLLLKNTLQTLFYYFISFITFFVYSNRATLFFLDLPFILRAKHFKVRKIFSLNTAQMAFFQTYFKEKKLLG